MYPLPIDSVYHTLPLHYVPHLLATGSLYSQRTLKAMGLPIMPRPTATRRDRKLSLDRYVHLSPHPITPLLRHKLEKGYPHVLLVFSAAILQERGTALILYNAKAWRHRLDFEPVTDPEDISQVWQEWKKGRYPSLEIVVPDSLPLVPHGTGLILSDTWQREWIEDLAQQWNLSLPLPLTDWAKNWPQCAPCDQEPYQEYTRTCLQAGKLLPPPNLPFD